MNSSPPPGRVQDERDRLANEVADLTVRVSDLRAERDAYGAEAAELESQVVQMRRRAQLLRRALDHGGRVRDRLEAQVATLQRERAVLEGISWVEHPPPRAVRGLEPGQAPLVAEGLRQIRSRVRQFSDPDADGVLRAVDALVHLLEPAEAATPEQAPPRPTASPTPPPPRPDGATAPAGVAVRPAIMAGILQRMLDDVDVDVEGLDPTDPGARDRYAIAVVLSDDPSPPPADVVVRMLPTGRAEAVQPASGAATESVPVESLFGLDEVIDFVRARLQDDASSPDA